MKLEKLAIRNAFLSNEIYLTTLDKEGTMTDKRKVVTDEVLKATFQYMMTNHKRTGKNRLFIDGVGEIKFTSYEQEEETV